jgi:hypothetical protein
VPLAVFDAGLTAAQRAWCEGLARVLPLPELIMPRDERMWQTWNKPRRIRASPFRTTLWLDADCLVVGDLNPLFDRAREGPSGPRHPPIKGGFTMFNKEELYRRFPVRRRIPEEASANAGVLGFGHDAQAERLLASWEGMVLWAAGDAEVRGLLGWHDQGALHWAVQAHDSPDVIVDQPGWDRFLWLPGRGGAEHFLQQLKIRPGDVVLHSIIRPKPWKSWGELT